MTDTIDEAALRDGIRNATAEVLAEAGLIAPAATIERLERERDMLLAGIRRLAAYTGAAGEEAQEVLELLDREKG